MSSPAVPVHRSDLLATTRWVMLIVIPVLFAAFVLLWLFPGDTDSLWSWTINPEMTALSMGGGYLAGVLFFAMAVRGRWAQIALGFVATVAFTTMLLIATVLHWEKFNHDHVSFWAWLGLYVITPVLLPVLAVANQKIAVDVPRRRVEVPRAIALVIGLSGVTMCARKTMLRRRWRLGRSPIRPNTHSR